MSAGRIRGGEDLAPYIKPCVRCGAMFTQRRKILMGGSSHGLWAKGPIFTVCSECAAKEARRLYPEMRVTVKH